MRVLSDLNPGRPGLGLAVDEVLLASCRRDDTSAVRFWVNRPAVVIGRSQAMADEVDLDEAGRLGIAVLRRISGGGAVFHDAGNLNISIVGPARALGGDVGTVFRRLGGRVAEGLAALCPGVIAEGNVLYIGEFKVGGGAQARRGDAVLYHTTVIVRPLSVELPSILRAMRPDYRPSGVASVPRQVVSLSEASGDAMPMGRAVEAVESSLRDELGGVWHHEDPTADETLESHRLAGTKYEERAWTFSR